MSCAVKEGPTVNPQAPVVVTGASGYIGSWIVRRLLEAGHTVRGTVRDPDKKSGLEHLHKLAHDHPGRLTLAKADLLDDGAFDAPMRGCELVVHNASPFIIAGIRDPDRELVQPALTGTRNVLSAVDRAPSVKRVVLTSSMVAIYGDAEEAERVPGGVFTEEQWNTTSSLEHQPYSYSKTVAEREAWRIQQAQDRWDLVTLHPGLVLGPSLTTASASTSLAIMKQFADGTMLAGAAELYFGVVDVRDVAEWHVRAGFTPEAKGRYLITADTLSLLQIGRILRRRFGELYAFPRTKVPKFLYRVIAPALGYTRTFVDRNVGYPLAFDSSRSRTELGLATAPWTTPSPSTSSRCWTTGSSSTSPSSEPGSPAGGGCGASGYGAFGLDAVRRRSGWWLERL
jgi:nucleoside-diphosphate-sugar epimerase